MIVSGVAAEVVLQYMDTYSRLRFSACNPGFRQFEKCYPLHINNLSLHNKGFQIDGTVYRLGIYRIYETRKRYPDMVKKNNQEGGVQHDTGIFDEYKFNDLADMDKGPSEKELAELEIMRKRIKEIRKVVKDNWEIRELKKKIRVINQKIAISKSKFEEFILLKISGGNHNEQLMVNYTKPIQEAFKDLMDRIFGGRRHQIHVRHLEDIDGFKNPLKAVKMQVKHLALEDYTDLSDVEDFFSTNSPPLETARCIYYGHEGDYSPEEEHKLLNTAKLLILEVGRIDNILEFDGRKFTNPRILFKCPDCFRSAYAIASNFKKENPAIKRHYTFEVIAGYELWNGEWRSEWIDIVEKFADEETKNHFIERGFPFPMTFNTKTNSGANLKFSADKKDDSTVTIDLELIP
ncbi:unnamed protein product [Caenorhabditis nigoni]